MTGEGRRDRKESLNSAELRSPNMCCTKKETGKWQRPQPTDQMPDRSPCAKLLNPKKDTKLIIGWGDRAAELAYKGRLCGNLQKIQLQGPPMQTS